MISSALTFEKATYRRGVLDELWVGGKNIIAPWGVEFADSSAFYSLDDGFGYRYSILEQSENVSGSLHTVNQIIRMREGLVRLELREWLENPTCMRRSVKLECLEDTILMDFVLRYRFLASCFQEGYIDGKILQYRNTRLYHQYPVELAGIGNPEYSVWVSVNNKSIPPNMKGYMYLRDGEGYWVLHLRMLPMIWEKEVIKLCSKWFKTKPLPQWISGLLLKNSYFKKAIWYRGERKPYRNHIVRFFSPHAYPMVKLQKSHVLLWDASCRLDLPYAMIPPN